MVPETGLWRFTFSGLVYNTDSGIAEVHLMVDGSSFSDYGEASAMLALDGGTSGYFMMSLNTLQQLNAGQNVSIEWKDYETAAKIYSGNHHYTHFSDNT